MIVGLVGNQNSGKTTLFNALTGSNSKVGNWPGVTIERKEGKLKNVRDTWIIDTPGVYSLSPYTEEEKVTRSFCVLEKPELIINLVDATSLERSLYLTTQLAELDADVIVVLNMTDVLENRGITIDEKKLSSLLGLTVIKISAKKGDGISSLINIIKERSDLKNEHKKIYSPDVQKEIDHLVKDLKTQLEEAKHPFFASVKIFERDPYFTALSNDATEKEIKAIEDKYEMDAEQIIADQRYRFVSKIKEECCHEESKGETITDKLDKVFLNKWAALPIFILIMGFVYFLSVFVMGELSKGFLNALFNGSQTILMFGQTIGFECKGLGPVLFDWLHYDLGSSYQVASLVRDGIVAGVGSVINFLPQLIMLFICLSILETTGYMSRISFFLDRVFKKLGLSGKSLVPFIVGSGCTVPAVMATRTIEDEREKSATIALTPFIPCSAKLPLISLFSSAIIGGPLAWLIAFSLYLMAIGMIILGALIIKKVCKSTSNSFISELPSYKSPSFKYVARDTLDKTFSFIRRAGTVILFCSVIVWFLSRFSWSMHYVGEIIERGHVVQEASLGDSMLGGIGKVLAFVFIPTLGGNYSWEASVSALQGLIAKEQVVSSLCVLSGSDNPLSNPSLSFFVTNGWAAYAFMVFNLFSSPCFGSIAAMKKETGSLKKTLMAISFETFLALFFSSLIGTIGWMINGFNFPGGL